MPEVCTGVRVPWWHTEGDTFWKCTMKAVGGMLWANNATLVVHRWFVLGDEVTGSAGPLRVRAPAREAAFRRRAISESRQNDHEPYEANDADERAHSRALTYVARSPGG